MKVHNEGTRLMRETVREVKVLLIQLKRGLAGTGIQPQKADVAVRSVSF